jgi:hypothetical protein
MTTKLALQKIIAGYYSQRRKKDNHKHESSEKINFMRGLDKHIKIEYTL